jgi:hypothetical protein
MQKKNIILQQYINRLYRHPSCQKIAPFFSPWHILPRFKKQVFLRGLKHLQKPYFCIYTLAATIRLNKLIVNN